MATPPPESSLPQASASTPALAPHIAPVFAARAEFSSIVSPVFAKQDAVRPMAAPEQHEVRKQFTLDTPDIVAVGILVLAISAAFVAAVVALGFVFGKVNGADTVKIVGTCVGGSTISGIV